jgi:hypothetical protein
MDVPDVLSRVALSLGIGLLIGLERGWRAREAEPGSRAAGIRTFAISGLLGGISAIATARWSGSAGGGIVPAVALAFAQPSSRRFVDENRADQAFRDDGHCRHPDIRARGHSAIGDIRAAQQPELQLRVCRSGRTARLVKNLTCPNWLGTVLLAMTFVALPVVPMNRSVRSAA